MEEFVNFQKFSGVETAEEFGELLSSNGIEYLLELPGVEDSAFPANNNVLQDIGIKLRLKDFAKADELLTSLYEKQIDINDKDYYLQSFTDDELLEVIAKPLEWNKYDYLLAKEILKQRGKDMIPDLLSVIKKIQINDLSKPKESRKVIIYYGYFMAPLGGFIAILIGHNLAYHKKTLPGGERIYAYSANDREHGIRIFYIGVISAIVWIAAWYILMVKH